MARVPDNLIKYECSECREQFIVSEVVADKVGIINCPYCTSDEVEAIVLDDNKDRLNEIGCLGIYHDDEQQEGCVKDESYIRT